MNVPQMTMGTPAQQQSQQQQGSSVAGSQGLTLVGGSAGSMGASQEPQDPAEAVIQRTQHDLINVSVTAQSSSSGVAILNTREGEKRGSEYKTIAVSRGIDVPAAQQLMGIPSTPVSTSISAARSMPNNAAAQIAPSSLGTASAVAASSQLSSSVTTPHALNSPSSGAAATPSADSDLIDSFAQQVSAGMSEVHVHDVGKIVSTLPVTE